MESKINVPMKLHNFFILIDGVELELGEDKRIINTIFRQKLSINSYYILS